MKHLRAIKMAVPALLAVAGTFAVSATAEAATTGSAAAVSTSAAASGSTVRPLTWQWWDTGAYFTSYAVCADYGAKLVSGGYAGNWGCSANLDGTWELWLYLDR